MRLSIGGLTPLTTIDFPGQLAAVVFCQGCAWRCAYCHNPHLLAVGYDGEGWPLLQEFLASRRGLLDGVVFSGGEPLFQSGLADAMEGVKSLGFKVALHTAGTHPGRLRRLLPLLDWVGLDIKTAFPRYPQLTGVAGSGAKARESLMLLLGSGVDHEVRTTADPRLLDRDGLLALAKELADLGVSRYVLQQCRPVAEHYPVDPGEAADFFRDRKLLQQLEKLFPDFVTRPA
ncbi:MAG TPA: anaerobic ribonucleoside-triphosphate reductase activating protein [Gammaproteobacteria bacterium]|nr:anaerobic ribonucleoside-triphosphate reductase activating protein [Gammaproteobacteria bacterium]